MKAIKKFIIGLVIGLLVGLWFGVNIGRDRSFYANPFAAASVKEKLRQTGESIMEKSGEALEKGGKAIKDKLQKQ